ncbi:hypothetical protein [Sorangium sp. So ce1182]|uniref:hypothetical protein n=1 Tax=Sorangium sp. So ce1182 TaxID=3133334 RepID=UPI003F62E4BA
MRSLQWRHVRRLGAIAAFSASGAGGLSGCTYAEECGDMRMCFAPPKSPCDVLEPGVGPVVDECGVFVSASARGDGPGAGTRLEPFTSLQQGIVEAQARGLHHVYACGETFEEEVTLISGVHLWGGRRCDDGDWAYGWSFDGSGHPTAIAPPLGIPLRVVGDEGATSVIFGARVVAADASASDGKSSIAMILSPGAKVNVVSSVVQAGNGKDGEAGEDAPSLRAKDGVLGNDGSDACTADLTVGALPVVTVCDDGTESTGGYGGEGRVDVGGAGASGQPAPEENPEGNGLGGSGADDTRCSPGSKGGQGDDAGRAAGAVGVGHLSIDGWAGVPGEDGKKGGVGQGGGGGGGSKSRGLMIACPTGLPQGGAAGGSGGSGGCGGLGGKGGGYGGASIGIVALQGSVLTVGASEVLAGGGGRGGAGGTGQPGGYGYNGGGAGATTVTGMWSACDGGAGGNGGRGGDAGGGLGGASLGVASMGATVTLSEDATVLPGNAGEGGLGGKAGPDVDEGKGTPGLATFWYRFDAPDPEPPR